MREFRDFDHFFQFYLEQHSHPGNRALHALGTLGGVGVFAGALIAGRPALAFAWVPFAYGCAWAGHFLLEGNRPATFGHPLWSFASDFRMLWWMATGKLRRQNSKGAGAGR